MSPREMQSNGQIASVAPSYPAEIRDLGEDSSDSQEYRSLEGTENYPLRGLPRGKTQGC